MTNNKEDMNSNVLSEPKHGCHFTTTDVTDYTNLITFELLVTGREMI